MDSSIVENGKKTSSEELIDLSQEIMPSTSLRGKRTDLKATHTLDLTDGSIDVSPPKRSRRAADKVIASVSETVELNDSENNDSTNSFESLPITKGRRGRSSKGKVAKQAKAPKVKTPKVQKAKRVTYKQALALAQAPVSNTPPVLPVQKQTARQRRSINRERSAQSSSGIDLTGDVHLTDKHSSAPLFQKASGSAVSKKKKEEEDEEDLLDMDLDLIKVKVKKKDVIKPYNHRRHQRYYDLYKAISDQNDIPISNIFLYDGETRIHPDDTPHSTGYKITTILTCRVMETAKASEFTQINKKNQIEMKFQSDKWKKPMVIKVSKLDSFKTAIEVLCEQIPFKPNQITLRFDGDEVVLKETPMDLDFEGGEILDCIIKA